MSNQAHNTLSLVGTVPTSSISSINKLLLSNSSNQSSPKNFIQIEHLLSRVDDESSHQEESSDSKWFNVRKSRTSNRLKVRMEDDRCQVLASLPPITSRGAIKGPPNRPQLFTDLLSDPTSNLPNLYALSPTTHTPIEMAQEYLGRRKASGPEPWRELLSGLGWKLDSSTFSSGNRYVLMGKNSATNAATPPNHLVLEVVIRNVMVLPPPGSPLNSSPTNLLTSHTDLLIQIIATVPSEETWKASGLDQVDSNNGTNSKESISALEKAKMELNRVRGLMRGLVEFRDDET